MHSLIHLAIAKGAKVYGSISGGKDGQAMVKTWIDAGHKFDGLIHADLGRIEWQASLRICIKQASQYNIPFHVVKRSDGRDMVDHWRYRMTQLKGTNKPFWSSSSSRYCTSDLKREPINKLLRSLSSDIVISCEGIRAEESSKRAKKPVLEIRRNITSAYYRGMTVEEAINSFVPGKRLALTYYPIFNFSLAEVWATYGIEQKTLDSVRNIYKNAGFVSPAWPFHPAYVYGNERVSCMFCVLGSENDLKVAAKQNPKLLQELISMEEEGNATFKNGWSLKQLSAVSEMNSKNKQCP